ncbi:MAG: NUDIX domain-containing protein [Ruminococcus sp.]|nr:NUDIX domain-containing protein [Ruminococcus sp.]
MKIKDVVGIAFIKDNHLLVVQSKRSSATNSYTFIGGSVEEGETILEASVREVSEEIHSGFAISPDDLELVLEKEEQAASDPTKTIRMHIFISYKEIDVPLVPNEEILIYHWYKIGDNINVSNSIKDFLEYAKTNNLMK